MDNFIILKIGSTNRFGSKYYIKLRNATGKIIFQYVFTKSEILKALTNDQIAKRQFLLYEYNQKNNYFPCIRK